MARCRWSLRAPELDEATVQHMDAVVDRLVVDGVHEKAIKAGVRQHPARRRRPASVQINQGRGQAEAERFYRSLCSATHHFVYGEIRPEYFVLQPSRERLPHCGGLGVYKLTHPELLVPDPKRSICGGCFVKEAYKYNPDTGTARS